MSSFATLTILILCILALAFFVNGFRIWWDGRKVPPVLGSPITDLELEKLRAMTFSAANYTWKSKDFLRRLIDQAVEANALRETVANLTDLDQLDVSVSKSGLVKGTVKGAAAGLMAAIIAKPLLDSDPPNYIEGRFTVTDPKTKLPIELVHIVQRVAGKTPHEKRVEAEAKLSDLELKAAGHRLELWATKKALESLHFDMCQGYQSIACVGRAPEQFGEAVEKQRVIIASLCKECP